jgi:uncharacterized protein YdeI (YjbR/CyaY-like superfamily)
MEEKHTWDKVNQWGAELIQLRTIIEKTELVATTKWGCEVYTVNNKNVQGLAGFKNYFAIWFWNGVFLKDETTVLVSANECGTRGLRQWRFTSATEIDEVLILKYIHEAIANEKAGISIKPEKKEAMHCDFFESELKNDGNFRTASEKLTSSKQKEFWEYMATAKHEKTKITRFEKIKPMILEARSINDKYRS